MSSLSQRIIYPSAYTGTVHSPPPKRRGQTVAIILCFLLSCTSVGVGGYWLGRYYAHDRTSRVANAPTPPALELPKGATMIAKCAPGRGTQYILPKDIPGGPVYNVWQGKVIGLEYMFGQDELLSGKDYRDLPLMNRPYEFANIGLLSQGHSGFESPHYHMDLYTISPEEAKKVKC
jgi:hypothetical protein